MLQVSAWTLVVRTVCEVSASIAANQYSVAVEVESSEGEARLDDGPDEVPKPGGCPKRGLSGTEWVTDQSSERSGVAIGLLVFEKGSKRVLTVREGERWGGPESWMYDEAKIDELLDAVAAASCVCVKLAVWDPVARERDESGRACSWYACIGEGKAGGAFRWQSPEAITQGGLGRVFRGWPGIGRVVTDLAKE